MEQHIEDARRRNLEPDASRELDHSLVFHDLFVQACGNPKLIQIHEVVKRHMRRYQLFAFSRLGRADRATAEHAEILEAFRLRDVAAIERLVVLHLQRVSDEIAPHLDASPPRPWSLDKSRKGNPMKTRTRGALVLVLLADRPRDGRGAGTGPRNRAES